MFNDLARDLVYACRLLKKSPAFTLAAILTLAIGIGANTAVFSAIYSVLLRPLPFEDPDHLVLITEYSPGSVAKTGSPLPRYQARAAAATAYTSTAAYWNVSGGNGLVFGANGPAERLTFSIVTSNFFRVLGIHPAIGRNFSPTEELPGAPKVFLAGDALWHRLLAGDPSAIGKTFRLDGEPYTLIGVMPPGFQFPAPCDLWVPLGTLGTSPLKDRVSHEFWMLGRLRPDFTLARAQVEMDAIQQRLAESYPATDANWKVTVRPLLEEFVGNVRFSMWILFGAVAFVLLIACTNVMNLLLARGVAREKEFAIRTALGAARPRLLRQALTETMLLVAAGTAVAMILAAAGLDALVTLSSGSIPRLEQPRLNGAVLAFSAGLALLTTLFIGIIPGLRAGGRITSAAPRSARVRNFLVVFEVALTLLLLSGAGVMLRSFDQLRHVDPGFQPDHLLSLRIALPDALYPKAAQRAAFLQQLLQRLNSTPAIRTAAATDRLPLSGENNWSRIHIAGRPLLDNEHAPSVEGRMVSANYFHTLGIPLLRGREFTDDDIAAGRRVTVINQEMADRFWPGANPVGQRVASLYRPDDLNEIIGVVGNIKDFALDAQSPAEMYTPYRWWNTMNLVLRGGDSDQAAIVSAVRANVAALDKEVPVYDIGRLDELISHSLARRRFELFLLTLFASIALLLAGVGIYGVLAFSVSRRTAEIGLRMALGARPRDVLAMIMSQGMKLVFLGAGLGLAAALALMRLLSSLLYRVSPVDPATLATVTFILIALSALACWIPARRATSVDPIVILNGRRRQP